MSTIICSRRTFITIAIVGLSMIPDTSSAMAMGAVAGQVEIKRGRKYKKDRSNVVIFLQGVPDSEPEPLRDRLSIDQTDKQFDPKIMVIPAGTTVDFPNNDRVFHNVFSVSRPAKFDLGLYKRGDSKSVTFEHPGVVDIYCNIHPEMSAKVLVLDTKHYAVTGADGSFSIEGVSPGSYPFVAWHAGGEQFEGMVTIRAGATATIEVELSEERWSQERHTQKDGTPYGRYK